MILIRQFALEENDPSSRTCCLPPLDAAVLFAVQLSPLEIAVFALVMDICHGGDARVIARWPPTKKRRGGIIDDARAQR